MEDATTIKQSIRQSAIVGIDSTTIWKSTKCIPIKNNCRRSFSRLL